MTAQTGGCGLPRRLRTETADCHLAVEAIANVPARVRSRAGYVDLLRRFHDLHSAFEARLQQQVWRPSWQALGIDLVAHRRSRLIAADLVGLAAPIPSDRLELTAFDTFGAALGCLYVLEGSALGGRVVAKLITAAIGEVPTAFLTGGGRPRAMLWANVRSALRRYESQGGDGDAVVVGARATFAAFGDRLAMAAI